MHHTKTSLFQTIFATMGFGKSRYTKAGVDALISLIGKYHGIAVNRRWGFNCLRCLEAEGLIRRRERYRHDENGKIRQLSSIITITLKGAYRLWAMGVVGAAKLIKAIKAWMAGKDKRWPRQEYIDEKFTPLEIKENERRLKELVFSL